jgi:hypothetical protein
VVFKGYHNWIFRCLKSVVLDGIQAFEEVHWISECPTNRKNKKQKNQLFEELFMLSGYETLGAEIDYRTIGS